MEVVLMLVVLISFVFLVGPLVGHLLAFMNGLFRPSIQGQGSVLHVDYCEEQEIPSYTDGAPTRISESWVAVVEVDGHMGTIKYYCEPTLKAGQTLPVKYRIGWNGEATWFATR